jgi:hypothetical protein
MAMLIDERVRRMTELRDQTEAGPLRDKLTEQLAELLMLVPKRVVKTLRPGKTKAQKEKEKKSFTI